MSEAFIHPSLTQDPADQAEYEALVWSVEGDQPLVLWTPEDAGFGALNRAVAWMRFDDEVVKAALFKKEQCWNMYEDCMETETVRTGSMSDEVEAGKQIHPTIVAQMMQAKQQHLSR